MFGPETLLLFGIDGTLLGGMPPTHRPNFLLRDLSELPRLAIASDASTNTPG